MVYKWNLDEVKKKQQYLLERLKNCPNITEKECIELSLVSNISILSNSGSLFHTKFYNFMDRLTKDKFSLSRQSKYIEMEKRLLFDNASYIDETYLQFLLTLANNIASDIEEETPMYEFNIDDEQMINVSKKFYETLDISQFKQLSMKILSDSSSINITSSSRSGFENFGGITYNDYIFNKSYINVQKTNTLFDFQVLNHEVMHGIDFYTHPKIPSKNYFGFHEIPTYTVDYLFLDFLESIGFDKGQVDILRQRKLNYLSGLAQVTLLQLKTQLIRTKGLKASIAPNIAMIKETITPQILKQLLEIESGLISYGLKRQIEYDKSKGLSNLLTIMNNDIPNNRKPDFTNVGLSDENLLQLSLEYRNNLSEYFSTDIRKK